MEYSKRKIGGVIVSMKENANELLQRKKGADVMSNVMERYATLDLQALSRKKGKIVSSQEALRDVKPVEWDKDVVQGKRKVIVTFAH